MMRKIILVAAIAAIAGPAFAQTTVITTTEQPSDTTRAAGTLAGTGTGAVAGALVGGPVGAVVGGVAGTVIGGAASSAPDEVRQYVIANPVEPVVVEGEINDSYVVPESVTLTPVPSNPDYVYFYNNDRPVIVSKADRRVVTYVER